MIRRGLRARDVKMMIVLHFRVGLRANEHYSERKCGSECRLCRLDLMQAATSQKVLLFLLEANHGLLGHKVLAN